MGRFRLCFVLTVAVTVTISHEPVAARVQVVTVHGVGLEGNLLDYNPDRTVWVYLPDGYDTSDRRYPVLYWLHAADGHGGAHSGMYRSLDDLIGAGAIEPMIVVTPDAGLSFYGNSVVSGNWEDFVAFELVDYVDTTFRTVPHPAARGVAGASMGGGGAIRAAMKHPDRFSAVYGMSPGGIGFTDIAYAEEGRGAFGEGNSRAFIPDPDNPPTYHEAVFEMVDGEERVNLEVWDRLSAATPLRMASNHVDNLANLRAIRFDVGTHDQWLHIPSGCRAFSAELTRLGIDHIFDEYDGDHGSLTGERIRDLVLPFFSENLTAGEEPEFFPRLQTFTPAVIATSVDRIVPLELRVEVEAGAWSQPPALDLGPLGRDEQVRLSGVNGSYTVDLELETPGNGHWDLPLWIESAHAAPYVYRFLSLCAYPANDLTVVDEGLAQDWVVTPKGGATVPAATSTVAPVRGKTALAFEVEPESFIGWSVGLEPPEPMPDFGYVSLEFWFHPGDATGRALNMGINDWATKLLSDDGDGIEVDLAVAEWQHVVIPISMLHLGSRPIERIQFNGNVKGMFHIDDMRLVLDPAAPSVRTAVAEERGSGRPDGFGLAQNYPNPFNAETTVVFDLATAQRIELVVYNLAAQKVATLASGPREAGSYSVRWDGRTDAGRELASGVYLYRLTTGEVSAVRKLLLLR